MVVTQGVMAVVRQGVMTVVRPGAMVVVTLSILAMGVTTGASVLVCYFRLQAFANYRTSDECQLMDNKLLKFLKQQD